MSKPCGFPPTPQSLVRGVTLAEVMIAATLGLLVMFGVTAINLGRINMQIDLRGRGQQVGDEIQPATALLQLINHLERADRINLISTGQPGVQPFSGPADVQLRLFESGNNASPSCPAPSCTTPGAAPAACCFLIGANFRWVEYRHVDTPDSGSAPDAIRFFDNTASGCGNTRLLTGSGRISALTFRYRDTADPPPGGDPDPAQFVSAPADTNALQYSMQWDSPGPLFGGGGLLSPNSRTYTGTVTSRLISYSDVKAGADGPGDSGQGLAGAGLTKPAPCP